MDFKTRTLQEIRALRAGIEQKLAVVGLDGFVDTIVTPVALRQGQGEAFTPMATIEELGRRILGAAGKSTNIEFYPRMDKLGGNGPIMAGALLSLGTQLKYIGALGRAAIHPVFQEIARRADVVSLCDPASTTAVEFTDGKLMLGQMRSLDEITYARIVEKMGEPALIQALGAADLVSLVNWTMIPNLTAILAEFKKSVLPRLPARPRHFFFDLCDPEKRSTSDLVVALETMASFGTNGEVTLGLNLKEAQQVAAALGVHAFPDNEEGLKTAAVDIRNRLNIAAVVVHPKESAACATAAGSWWIPGPYTEKPFITTGAGDHFNAGFMTGRLLGLAPEACLGLGVSTSGHYVRTAESPSLDQIETFLANWR
jgi:sugar/nucleoside kinase (ribokinase family)